MAYIKNLLIIVFQISVLWLFNEIGNWIVSRLKIPISGGVMGMLLLFFLLWGKIVPLKWVERTSRLLISHMSFFFIPLAVGLMSYGPLLKQHGLAIVGSIVISAVLGILVSGWTSQRLVQNGGKASCGKE